MEPSDSTESLYKAVSETGNDCCLPARVSSNDHVKAGLAENKSPDVLANELRVRGLGILTAQKRPTPTCFHCMNRDLDASTPTGEEILAADHGPNADGNLRSYLAGICSQADNVLAAGTLARSTDRQRSYHLSMPNLCQQCALRYQKTVEAGRNPRGGSSEGHRRLTSAPASIRRSLHGL